MTSTRIKNRLHGIIAPMATPFNRQGGIDEGAFLSNLRRYSGIGLAGVMVAGTSGEAPFLTSRERLRLTELARKLIGPDELVLTGTGLESTRETAALSREAVARGADLVLVVTPGYYKSKMDGPALLAHYRAVADAVAKPMLLYSIPQCTGVRVPVDTIAALSRHPNIAGLKESSGDFAYLRRILRSVESGFRVFSGNLAILLKALYAGAAGGIVSQADFAPELCLAFYEAFRQGRHKVARELHARLVPLALEINVKYGAPALKVAMDLAGYRGGEPRSPLLPVTVEARRRIARTLKAAQTSLAF
jgi:dihydrodipicolinate synthase/N-acetylneuraminate lyase